MIKFDENNYFHCEVFIEKDKVGIENIEILLSEKLNTNPPNRSITGDFFLIRINENTYKELGGYLNDFLNFYNLR